MLRCSQVENAAAPEAVLDSKLDSLQENNPVCVVERRCDDVTE